MDHRPVARTRWLVLTVMCVGYFLVLLDVTIVNVALPRIGAGVGADVTGLQWVVDGYALVLASLLLISGTCGDLFGHRRVVLAGLAVFGVASLGCAVAPSTGTLVAARAGQGLGAALLLPGTLAIISRAFPDRQEQARAIGIWAAVGSIALPAGPLLGGLLVQTAGWRAVFFVNVPIVAVAAVIAARVVREDPPSGGRRLDLPGVLTGGLFLASLTYAVIAAGHAGWGAPVAVAAALAVVLLAAFLAVEHAAADPMLPLGLFRRPDFSTANAAAGLMNLGTLGLLFLLTMFLQTVQHRPALAAGLAVLPLFLPLSLLAPVTGRVTARIGPRWPMAVGLAVAAVGMLLLTRVQPGSGYPTLLPALLLWGVGLGLLTPAVVAAAIGAVEGSRAGLASGMNNTARQAGGAIGIAVYGALAGPATRPAAFVAGMHLTGVLTAVLWLAAAGATVALVPGSRSR
jgi:DHA2 family methylenomycin A resistance protein-like MFS transporter